MEKEYLYQTNDPQRIKEAQKKMPDTSSIEQLADFYKVMGDTTRLKLLMALETGEFCASDLAREFDSYFYQWTSFQRLNRRFSFTFFVKLFDFIYRILLYFVI